MRLTLLFLILLRGIAAAAPPVWSDEFDGPDGSLPDPRKWDVVVQGNPSNQELQYYTQRPANVQVRGGQLVITALKEPYQGRQYTSARLESKGRFAQRYGRFEARIKIPRGQGMWPAFWMLGSDKPAAGWPGCGEIDVMENIGREPALIHGTLHGPGYSGGQGLTASTRINGAFADKFHVYAVEWRPDRIDFILDDRVYATRRPADVPAGTRWVYDHPFYLLVNLAVGGGWPGSPDATTVFPQQMVVDYVRVYAPGGRE